MDCTRRQQTSWQTRWLGLAQGQTANKPACVCVLCVSVSLTGCGKVEQPQTQSVTSGTVTVNMRVCAGSPGSPARPLDLGQWQYGPFSGHCYCFCTSWLLRIPQQKKNRKGMRHVSGSQLHTGVTWPRGCAAAFTTDIFKRKLKTCIFSLYKLWFYSLFMISFYVYISFLLMLLALLTKYHKCFFCFCYSIRFLIS